MENGKRVPVLTRSVCGRVRKSEALGGLPHLVHWRPVGSFSLSWAGMRLSGSSNDVEIDGVQVV